MLRCTTTVCLMIASSLTIALGPISSTLAAVVTSSRTDSAMATTVRHDRKGLDGNYQLYSAAACCARGPGCWPMHSRATNDVCKVGIWMSAQTQECRQAACQFCKTGVENRKRAVCGSVPILKNCFGLKPPYPKPHPDYQPYRDYIEKHPSPGPLVNNSALPSPVLKDAPSATPMIIKSPSPNKESEMPPRNAKSPTPSPSPVVSSPANGKCVFQAKDGILMIPAPSFPIPDNAQWARTHNGRAVTWRRNGGAGIDAPENGAGFCIRVMADTDGLHYFTVLSSAPHVTDHNDAWFRFPSLPEGASVLLYRADKKTRFLSSGTEWLKGFQNDGGDKMANYISHKDHDGHQFILDGLKRGDVYSICIAGRSSRYSLYGAVTVACPSVDECGRDRTNIRKALRQLTTSQCI